MSDFSSKTYLSFQKNLFIKFFSRCNYYKVQPTKFVAFMMEQFSNYSPHAEELMKLFLENEKRRYTIAMEEDYKKCSLVAHLKEKGNFIPDIEENVKD
jgi:hypothetical protein